MYMPIDVFFRTSFILLNIYSLYLNDVDGSFSNNNIDTFQAGAANSKYKYTYFSSIPHLLSHFQNGLGMYKNVRFRSIR